MEPSDDIGRQWPSSQALPPADAGSEPASPPHPVPVTKTLPTDPTSPHSIKIFDTLPEPPSLDILSLDNHRGETGEDHASTVNDPIQRPDGPVPYSSMGYSRRDCKTPDLRGTGRHSMRYLPPRWSWEPSQGGPDLFLCSAIPQWHIASIIHPLSPQFIDLPSRETTAPIGTLPEGWSAILRPNGHVSYFPCTSTQIRTIITDQEAFEAQSSACDPRTGQTCQELKTWPEHRDVTLLDYLGTRVHHSLISRKSISPTQIKVPVALSRPVTPDCMTPQLEMNTNPDTSVQNLAPTSGCASRAQSSLSREKSSTVAPREARQSEDRARYVLTDESGPASATGATANLTVTLEMGGHKPLSPALPSAEPNNSESSDAETQAQPLPHWAFTEATDLYCTKYFQWARCCPVCKVLFTCTTRVCEYCRRINYPLAPELYYRFLEIMPQALLHMRLRQSGAPTPVELLCDGTT